MSNQKSNHTGQVCWSCKCKSTFSHVYFLFFFLHGWTIHKFHALGSFKILCKDCVNVCVCVCGEERKKEIKIKIINFVIEVEMLWNKICQKKNWMPKFKLNVGMGIIKKIRENNWCPRHIFSQGCVCPRQTLKAWDRVSWSLPCVYGK